MRKPEEIACVFYEEIGIKIPDDVQDKCAELCTIYSMSPTEFLETWVAYTVSGEADIIPALESICRMEKKVLAKHHSATTPNSTHRSPVSVCNPNFISDNDGDVFGMYSATTDENGSEMSTPKLVRSVPRTARTPKMLFSPASFSPSTTEKSKKYSERTNSGIIVCSFGQCAESTKWSCVSQRSASIESLEGCGLMDSKIRYMFDTVTDKICYLFEETAAVCQRIVEQYNLDAPQPLDSVSLEKTIYAGRICCDSNGRLNASSVVLENGVYGAHMDSVPLDISKAPDFSLFPGQVVVLEGTNPTGDRIFAEKFYTDVLLPESAEPDELLCLDGPLEIVVAAGPFTPSDTLSYQPIEDLVQYVLKHNPHVLMLIGPIVDILHPLIADSVIAESFADCYSRILQEVAKQLSNTRIKIVVVSSWREAGYHVVYPTPTPRCTSLKNQYPNLHLLPDPSMITICGVSIGVTSTDILMHLGKEEIFFSSTTKPDRLSRLASHLIQQQNFYPLIPPAEEVSMDYDLWWHYARMPRMPHVLILPSDLRYFVKSIRGCVTLNPERLTKGQVGGNFARMQVRLPKDDEMWSPESHIDVQIVKI